MQISHPELFETEQQSQWGHREQLRGFYQHKQSWLVCLLYNGSLKVNTHTLVLNAVTDDECCFRCSTVEVLSGQSRTAQTCSLEVTHTQCLLSDVSSLNPYLVNSSISESISGSLLPVSVELQSGWPESLMCLTWQKNQSPTSVNSSGAACKER